MTDIPLSNAEIDRRKQELSPVNSIPQLTIQFVNKPAKLSVIQNKTKQNCKMNENLNSIL